MLDELAAAAVVADVVAVAVLVRSVSASWASARWRTRAARQADSRPERRCRIKYRGGTFLLRSMDIYCGHAGAFLA